MDCDCSRARRLSFQEGGYKVAGVKRTVKRLSNRAADNEALILEWQIITGTGNGNADAIMDGNVHSGDLITHSGGRYVRPLMVLWKTDQTYA